MTRVLTVIFVFIFSAPSLFAQDVGSRDIIRQANIRMRVQNTSEAAERIKALVAERAGYFSGEHLSVGVTSRSVRLILRVPRANFESALAEIVKSAVVTPERTVKGEDVTDELYDLDLNITSKKKSEDELFGILRRARNVSEVLEVREKLDAIRNEIEGLEGRRRFLADRVAYASLNVTVYVYEWSTGGDERGFFKRAWDALLGGWDEVLNLILDFTAVWPLWIFLGVGGYFAYPRLRKLWIRARAA